MKQKLFENIGGNTFKLITESVDEVNPKAKLVREGLKKVFGAGSKQLSYKKLQGVGLGYIKSVEEAKKTAIQEARELAKEYGYMDDENSQKFVKEEDKPSGIRPDWRPDKQKESREVQIGKEILRLTGYGQLDIDQTQIVRKLAQELIQMHSESPVPHNSIGEQ